jgi:hypothetical protein
VFLLRQTKENEQELLRYAFAYSLFSLKIKTMDNKIVPVFIQTQQYIIVFYLDDDMFRSLDHHQAIFRKLDYGTCSANKVHVIWNPVRLTAVLQYIKNGIR